MGEPTTKIGVRAQNGNVNDGRLNGDSRRLLPFITMFFAGEASLHGPGATHGTGGLSVQHVTDEEGAGSRAADQAAAENRAADLAGAGDQRGAGGGRRAKKDVGEAAPAALNQAHTL